MMKLKHFFLTVTSILLLSSCNKNTDFSPEKASQISYEKLSTTSFQDALFIAASRLHDIQLIRDKNSSSFRNEIPNETVENASWLFEAMSNLEFRKSDRNFSKFNKFELSIEVDKVGNEISGANLALKYNELFNEIVNRTGESEKLLVLDVSLDHENTTAARAVFSAKGITGNVIQYFDSCIVREDDYWWAGGQSGTCRPNSEDDEFYLEKDASDRLAQIINSPICFGSGMCSTGTESNIIALSVNGVIYNYDDSSLGNLYYSAGNTCLSPTDMESSVAKLRDILLNSNPIPNTLDFLGITVQDEVVITQGDLFNFYHHGICYYAAFGCVEIELPPFTICC